MSRSSRLLAALMLSVMLPVQGWAVVSAQICTRMSEERDAVMPAAGSHHQASADDEAAPHDHGGKGQLDAGKCCHAQVFMVLMPQILDPAPPPSPHPAALVARWTSFIPEEPSPPPIVSAPVA